MYKNTRSAEKSVQEGGSKPCLLTLTAWTLDAPQRLGCQWVSPWGTAWNLERWAQMERNQVIWSEPLSTLSAHKAWPLLLLGPTRQAACLYSIPLAMVSCLSLGTRTMVPRNPYWTLWNDEPKIKLPYLLTDNWLKTRNTDQWDWIERPGIYSCTQLQLIFDTGVMNLHEGKKASSTASCKKIWYPPAKKREEIGPLFYII